jgi:MerR family copper efflux transcriptional regulator
MSADKLFKIGELAKLTEKTARALHLYEEMDLLAPAERTQGGFRLYDFENVSRIRYIDRLQKLGYSLGEIRELVAAWRAEPTGRDAMASMEDVYRARLSEVRRTLDDLRALEGELVDSLAFLEGCHTCGVEANPSNACGECDRSEDNDSLTLISGLPAH